MPGWGAGEEVRRSPHRAVGFIQTMLPAQKTHFLFIIGSLFFYAAAFAPWLSWRRLLTELPISRSEVMRWSLYIALPIRLLLLFAAIKSFWACFLTGKAPGRTIINWVFLPALLSLALFALSIVRLVMSPPESVLETSGDMVHRGLANLSRVSVALGAGFYFALAGLVLLSGGVLLLNRRLTTLPVRFVDDNPASFSEGSKNDPVRAIVIFGSISLALPWVVSSLVGLALILAPINVSQSGLAEIALLAFSAPMLSAVYVLGEDRKAKLWAMLRISSLQSYGLALGLPALVIGIPQLVYYCAARWTGGIEPFVIEEFNPHVIPLAWLVVYVVAALFEEVGWRGYLQPKIIRRFGVRRGILLVGLVWGAFHLSGDLDGLAGLSTAVTRLATRLLFTTILAIAFGWLRMYSGSFLPVAVMHAEYNILIQHVRSALLPFKPPGAIWAAMGAWALVGYLLFMYWPLRGREPASAALPSP